MLFSANKMYMTMLLDFKIKKLEIQIQNSKFSYINKQVMLLKRYGSYIKK